MLRQATLNETFLLESFRSFNPPNAEAGDVERNVTHTLLESFRSFNPPNAEAGDVGPNVTHTVDSNHLRDTPTASLLTLPMYVSFNVACLSIGRVKTPK